MRNKINKRLNIHYGGKIFAKEENGCLYIKGELSDWQEIVRAGLISVNRKKYTGLINEIRLTGVEIPPMKLPGVSDKMQDGTRPDVLA